jgi:peptidoglycan/xylan/chitin deacetylase (PgdA/CDA1 family)
MKNIHLLILGISLLLTSCGTEAVAAPETVNSAIEPTITLTPFQPQPDTPTPVPTSTVTPTPTETPSATPKVDSSPTSASTLRQAPSEPDKLNVPVLLYHQIAVPPDENPYYTTPENFAAQMELLYSEGYMTISTEMLVNAIKDGTQLPEKPVILTFDDGNISVLTTAFPIMKKYGFTGVAYIVYKYLGAAGSLDVSQVQTLAESGWEIGSHSFSHADLVEHEERQKKEILTSRVMLERKLDLPVLTFAYPYGNYNGDAVDLVKRAGYMAAFGVENNHKHELDSLFSLNRLEVKGDYDIDQFSSLLSELGIPLLTPASTSQP